MHLFTCDSHALEFREVVGMETNNNVAMKTKESLSCVTSHLCGRDLQHCRGKFTASPQQHNYLTAVTMHTNTGQNKNMFTAMSTNRKL